MLTNPQLPTARICPQARACWAQVPPAPHCASLNDLVKCGIRTFMFAKGCVGGWPTQAGHTHTLIPVDLLDEDNNVSALVFSDQHRVFERERVSGGGLCWGRCFFGE